MKRLLVCSALLVSEPVLALTVEDGEADNGVRSQIERQALPPLSDVPATTRHDGQGSVNDDGALSTDATTPGPRFDFDTLPEPVARLRAALLEAAASGDVDAVARLVDADTQLSFDPEGRSAREQLLEQSGDEEGFEVLAILSEVLEAGYVVLDEGTPDALYLWPYFAAVPLEELAPEQKVDLFRILTAGDYEASLEFGSYIFYRLGIGANGEWRFFVAGD